MVDFRAIIDNLHNIHFYDVFLPFILVYVVIFAILEKSAIFKVKEGDNSHIKNVHSLIAFVFALFVVASIQTVFFIEQLVVIISLIVIFILCVLILLAFIFGDEYQMLLRDSEGKVKGWISWTIAIVVFLVALGVLFWILDVWGWINYYLGGFYMQDFWTVVVVVVIIGAMVWVTKGDSSGSKKE